MHRKSKSPQNKRAKEFFVGPSKQKQDEEIMNGKFRKKELQMNKNKRK